MDSKVVQPSAKKRPPRAGMGRPAGIPNKTTRDFREAVNHLLQEAAPNMVGWLEQVANGGDGKPPAPEKALDLLAKLAEYAAPKLSRTEVAGDQDSPLAHRVQIEIVDSSTK